MRNTKRKPDEGRAKSHSSELISIEFTGAARLALIEFDHNMKFGRRFY